MSSQEQEQSDVEPCSICLLVKNPEYPTEKCWQCNKKHHKSCITRWLRKGPRCTCPNCRANMTELARSLGLPIQQTRQNTTINNYAVTSQEDDTDLDGGFGSTCPCS